MADHYDLVVAIDFGTYGTGFAYAQAAEAAKSPPERDMFVFRDWEHSDRFRYFKTRTALLRAKTGEVVGWGNDAVYRAEIDQDQGTLTEYFKPDLTSASAEAREQAVADSVDFLSGLRTRILAHLARRHIRVPEDRIRWCLSMPVQDGGLEGYDSVLRTEIAPAAGFPADRDRLVTALEPEAAALCLHAASDDDDFMRGGNVFTVVDAGGGTVDISTFQVRDDSSLNQVGLVAGGRLGSKNLNNNFLGLVLERLRKLRGWQRDASPEPGDWQIIRSSWESYKRQWNSLSASLYSIRVPRRADRESDPPGPLSGDDGELSFSVADIAGEVFGPLVSGIISRVDVALSEVSEGLKSQRILLVGGFGGSPYLQQELRDHVGHRVPVICFPDPDSAEAVLRGTVHYGLNPRSVHERRIQYTYGLEIAGPCERPQLPHPARHRTVQAAQFSQPEEVCDHLRLFARRGEVIRGRTERSLGRLRPSSYRQGEVVFKLFTSQDDDPYFITQASPLGSLKIPLRMSDWRASSTPAFDVSVVLGEADLVFYACDAKNPKKKYELPLHFLENEG
jgi:hypothetical protein